MEKWKKGMLVGAALGLLVSLIDRQEREKVKDYSRNMKMKCAKCIHNHHKPSRNYEQSYMMSQEALIVSSNNWIS